MSSSRSYLEYIIDQLSGLDGISWRSMMGEYIIYCKGKIIGGIYDDRFLVKHTKAAAEMMPQAAQEKPYEGAKDMLLVSDTDDREFLQALVTAIYEELPARNKRK